MTRPVDDPDQWATVARDPDADPADLMWIASMSDDHDILAAIVANPSAPTGTTVSILNRCTPLVVALGWRSEFGQARGALLELLAHTRSSKIHVAALEGPDWALSLVLTNKNLDSDSVAVGAKRVLSRIAAYTDCVPSRADEEGSLRIGDRVDAWAIGRHPAATDETLLALADLDDPRLLLSLTSRDRLPAAVADRILRRHAHVGRQLRGDRDRRGQRLD